MLQLVYVPLVRDFTRIHFKSVGHFAKMSKRLMKITSTLLSRFDPGPCAVAAIGIKQPAPRFDPMLEIIFKALNNINFESFLEILELQELNGFSRDHNNVRQSFIQNKYLATLY